MSNDSFNRKPTYRERNLMLSQRHILGLLVVILFAISASACGSVPSAGKVDVGGYQLAYQCFGEGTPTIIIEAGMGEAPTINGNWGTVIETIKTITRICIYDRAGLGQSDAAPTPRTSLNIAQDLHTLLTAIPVPGPYILVAHSIGGFHARVFASQYPLDVVGVILVDSSNPDQFEQFSLAYPTPAPAEAPALATQRPFFQDWPPPASNPEGLDLAASAAQVRESGSLGATPLIVISQSINPGMWDIEGFTDEDKQRFAEMRQQLQADLATISSSSVHITAQDAGHYIHVDAPQVVIDAITQMVQDYRNQ